MNRLTPLFLCLVLSGCSEWTPTAGEDDVVGTNTNWFRVCDTDAECGDDLACLCGMCTKACSQTSECGQKDVGTCPIDLGAYAAACGPRIALDASRNACFRACQRNADCPADQVCAGGGCAVVEYQACESVTQVTLSSPTGALWARKGGLFGDRIYVPQWYPAKPQGWVEPYQPSVLTARVTDQSNSPVAGCEVKFYTEEGSGFASSQDAVSDENGEVRALWVAGSASTQRLAAMVHSGSTWLTAQVTGEARGHDETPLAGGPEARNSTAPSGVVVSPPESEPSEHARMTFTSLTFPPGIAYVVLETPHVALSYWNDGPVDAANSDVPASDRLFDVRVFDFGGEPGGVIAMSSGAYCTQDALSFRCSLPDAWLPGESIHIDLGVRHVAAGETPSEYDTTNYAKNPCYSISGCTDFSISTQRAGEPMELRAVVRSAGLDTLSNRSAYIGGVYTPEIGIARTCLETKRAAFVTLQELLLDGEWQRVRGGTSYGFHETWNNLICANYMTDDGVDGYYLSTGGPSSISTPSVPGFAREL